MLCWLYLFMDQEQEEFPEEEIAFSCVFISRRKWSRNNTKSFKSPSHQQNPKPRRIKMENHLLGKTHSQNNKITSKLTSFLDVSLIHSFTHLLLVVNPLFIQFLHLWWYLVSWTGFTWIFPSTTFTFSMNAFSIINYSILPVILMLRST